MEQIEVDWKSTNEENAIDQNKINENASLPKDTLYMGTIGRITAYDVSQPHDPNSLDRSLPIKWVKQIYETSLTGKFHNTAFCLHPDRPILYSCFNGTVTAISAESGDTLFQVRPSKSSGIFADDLGTISVTPSRLFYGCNGYGACLDPYSGQILWETNLKKTGYHNVALLPFSHNTIIMGSHGTCYAIDIETGKILWENNLEGTGYGDISLAKYRINSHGSYSAEILIVGTDGYIVNIDPKTGETKVKTNLKGTGYHPVSLLVDGGMNLLFVSTFGKCYCFHPESHREIWKNEMKDMGMSHGQSIAEIGDYIFVGTWGKVMCINKKMGTSVWTESLPSCGYEIVTLQVHSGRLLAGSNGKLYELEPKSGQVLWRDNMKGYSYSYIYLGSYATFGCTDHNSTTIVQYIAENRRNRNKYHHG